MTNSPIKITAKILNLNSEIHELLGEIKNFSVGKASVKLRRENKIKTVQHSLAIEGNDLIESQITAILENKRVLGPAKQILEVKNALALYDSLTEIDPLKEKQLLLSHKILMQGLLKSAGKYRSGQVGIFKGSKVSHVAPPAKQVPRLMSDLFNFLKKDENSWIIKACVFHYELEFIHPFDDGNGLMGRLWQQLLLMKYAKVFEYISTETIVHERQKQYYAVLEICDTSGEFTLFLEFSLEVILEGLQKFKSANRIPKPSAPDRIQFALNHFKSKSFTRKDYLNLFPELSTATASRDLTKAVKENQLKISGEKSKAEYKA